LQAIRKAFAAGLIWFLRGTSINLISIVIMAQTIHFRLTMLALIPIVCSAIMVLILRPIIRRRFRTVQDKFADVSDKVQENLSGIRVIKSYVQEDREIEKLTHASQARMKAHMDYIRASALYDPAVRLFFGISFTLNLFLGSAYVVNGIITLGDFIAFNSYIAMLTVPVMDIGRMVVRWQNAVASIKRLDEVMTIQSDIFDDISFNAANPAERRFTGDIRIKRLNFTYPYESAATLHNINLHLKGGKTLAIVGDTGSGKTTLVNLLVRLFRVERGCIFIDGVDVNDIPLAVLRENVGYAPQDNFLFSTSIKENIASFKDQYADEAIVDATRVSQVYDNIVDFPEGFETILGERGITLSGGQKQRISLARAIIKDPAILILDDTFSAVDTETEEHILQNLRQIMAERTVILIAHRISTVKYADEILVLDHGRILERGTHQTLLQREGKYYDMYLAQLTEEHKDVQERHVKRRER
jgi:ATP-binding cassette subfamily B protein